MTAATANAPFALDSPRAAPLTALASILATAVALLHPTAWSMIATWGGSSSYHHGFFVAPLTVWMIASGGARIPAQSSPVPGIIIMAAAGLLWLAGRAAGAALIEQTAFVSLVIGGVGVAFGAQALRQWAWPLAFLYFMVPFGGVIVSALQSFTAHFVVASLSLFRLPVAIEGALITTRAGAFEVGEACAGLRFLIAALMIAAVFAQISFRTWRKRALFLAFAVALSIAANGVRAFVLVLAATLTDKRLAVGPDHLLVGWAFYAVILIALIAIGRRYADAPAREAARIESPNNARIAALLPAVAIIAALSIYADLVVDRSVARVAPTSLSLLNAPGWRILPPPESWRARFQGADRTGAATYVAGARRVYISFGLYTHDRRGAEIVNDANRAWDGRDWRKIANAPAVVYLFGVSEKTGFELLAGPERRRLATVTAYWFDGAIYNDPRRLKFDQMKAKLAGRNPAGGVIVIAASYGRDPKDAVADIRAFTSAVEPLDGWLARNSSR